MYVYLASHITLGLLRYVDLNMFTLKCRCVLTVALGCNYGNEKVTHLQWWKHVVMVAGVGTTRGCAQIPRLLVAS